MLKEATDNYLDNSCSEFGLLLKDEKIIFRYHDNHELVLIDSGLDVAVRRRVKLLDLSMDSRCSLFSSILLSLLLSLESSSPCSI